MTIQSQIREIWEAEPNEDEAFASFDCEGIEPDIIRTTLGARVAEGYNTWVYINLK